MKDLESIRAVRVGTAGPAYRQRDYVYRGDQPFVPPKNPPRVAVCSVEGCAGAIKAKGLCESHYKKSRRDDKRRKPFDPSKCGDKNGYNHHLYHGVEVCQPCRDAKNKYERQTYAKRMGGGK